MSKLYGFDFGSGNPSAYTGLSPSLIIFSWEGVTALVPPGVTETPAGSGLYHFFYGPTVAIKFLIDGGPAITTISDRYISGILDPISTVDQTVGALNDSFGSTSVDPSTVIGYLKRTQEFLEGDALFTKATGEWQVFSRGGSVLLVTKDLTNTTTAATKS